MIEQGNPGKSIDSKQWKNVQWETSTIISYSFFSISALQKYANPIDFQISFFIVSPTKNLHNFSKLRRLIPKKYKYPSVKEVSFIVVEVPIRINGDAASFSAYSFEPEFIMMTHGIHVVRHKRPLVRASYESHDMH